MEYISVKNLEKYHPGYKDRTMTWAKIHITMVQGDPEFELIESEIDKWRFIAMILLQMKAKKPLPNVDRYWSSKGFNLKKRPMSLTLKMLHNFVVAVTEDGGGACRRIDKDKDKDKEADTEVKADGSVFRPPLLAAVQQYCQDRNNNIIAQDFIDFYQAKGWMIGKNKMKDWKAAVRTWESRHKEPECSKNEHKL